MGKSAVCDKCKRIYEYNPKTEYKGGTSYTTVTCEHCGYTKTTSVNHIHYGNDGK